MVNVGLNETGKIGNGYMRADGFDVTVAIGSQIHAEMKMHN